MEGGPSLQTNENSEEVDKDVGCYMGLCDPRRKQHRYVALFFMCLLSFGFYFCYDTPGALQDNLLVDLNITMVQFSLFYSVYSWPNVILCFIGGFLIDSVFGIRLGANLYLGLTLIGQILFATGGFLGVFWLMLLGRFILGIGAESGTVAQNSYAVLWFKGKELNMMFGLQIGIAKFGSVINFMTMEHIYKWVNISYTGRTCIGIVLFIASLTCVLSLICSIVLGIIDKRAERILRRNDSSSVQVVRLRDIKDFPISFWILIVVNVAFHMAIYPFISFGKVFFMEKFHMVPDDANTVNSIVYLTSALASPFTGYIIDWTGRNLFWVFFSININVGAHMLLAFTEHNPYIATIIMGISFSIFASALWPLIAIIIPEHQLGTAFGICQSALNAGSTIALIVAGMILDNFGYYWLELSFMGSLFVGLLGTTTLILRDNCGTGFLNMSPKQREEHQSRTLEAQAKERKQLLNEVATGMIPM